MKNVLMLSAVVLLVAIAAAPASADTISLVGGTLTYGSPSDLGNAASIALATGSPAPTLLPVHTSLTSSSGPTLTSLAAFEALQGVQVVNFNDATTNSNTPFSTIVANYDGTHNITFSAQNAVTFLYGYDNVVGGNREAFSGPTIDSDVRVVGANGTPSGDPNTLMEWLNLSVSVTDATKGLTAIGACFAHRNDQGGGPPVTDAVIYLSGGSTVIAKIPGSEIPTNGGGNNDDVWFGYQAPAGQAITGIVLGFQTTGGGNNNEGMDDLSFVVSSLAVPEPATMSLLILGGIGMIGGAIRRRKVA